jgi:hypothetical protein
MSEEHYYDHKADYEEHYRQRISDILEDAEELGMPIMVLVGTSMEEEGATVQIAESFPLDEEGEIIPERLPSFLALVNVLYHNMTAYKLVGTFVNELQKQDILSEDPANYDLTSLGFFGKEEQEDEEGE